MAVREFVAVNQSEIDNLLKRIGENFALREGKTRKVNETYYDTFDWLLYGNKRVLTRRGKSFYLKRIDNGLLVKGAGFDRKQFFFWDLEQGVLRDSLRPLCDIRALIKILTMRTASKSFAILNKDRKTVARLTVDSSTVAASGVEQEVPPVLTLTEVRGYENPFTKVLQLLDSAELDDLQNSRSRFDLALAAINKKPLDYSSKFSIFLEPSTDVRSAVSSICLELVRAMDRNYDGVINDVDSEFLHDFRIAVRRTRSLLSQMKKALPPGANSHFQQEFKWIGTLTGPVRDIDVYLLMREEYLKMVPAQLYQGIDYFFQDLDLKRKDHFRYMKNGLTSGRYESLMADWQQFLCSDEKDEHDHWPQGGKSCKKAARKVLKKRFSRILRDGMAITDESPDETLHRLRIQGKKLRYLLEFFRSFYQEEDIDFFLKQLKKLQNNLGDFNDFSVQQEMLTAHQSELTGRNKRSISIAAAIGGLLSHLNGQKQQVRRKFQSTFSGFASEKNIERFTSILE